MDLSISIASYNTLELTRQCLRSILDNTARVSCEVIVVDNDSHDGSQDMIRAEFPTVTLISNSDNVGVANATNQAIARSTGRYFLTMNSDVVVKPGALDVLVEFMDKYPDAGASSARLVRPDGEDHPPVCGNVPSAKSEILEALGPLSRSFAQAALRARLGAPMDYHKSQAVPCITWGTAYIVRREVLETVGGQDPAFYVYGEDTDWSIRIASAGWKLYYVAEAEIIHYGGQTTKQASTKMQAQLQKSKVRLVQKHCGLVSGITLRLVIAMVSMIRVAKWLPLYLLPGKRVKASMRIQQMWSIIRAVIAY